jgi:hypothetical protein
VGRTFFDPLHVIAVGMGVTRADISADGAWIVTAGDDEPPTLWDAGSAGLNGGLTPAELGSGRFDFPGTQALSLPLLPKAKLMYGSERPADALCRSRRAEIRSGQRRFHPTERRF